MKPGEIVQAWDDDENAIGIVVATSRHKGQRLGHHVARDRLAAVAALSLIGRDADPDPLYRLLVMRNSWTWRTITASETHECHSDPCDGEPGEWCSEGAGQAWVEVLSVTHNEVYDLLDNPDRATA